MNFTISHADDQYIEMAPRFAELYNRNWRVDAIKSELGIGKSIYNKLRKYCVEEGLITLRNGRPKDMSSYKRNPRNYSIIRHGKYTYWAVEHKRVYYCTCHSVQEAEFMVAKLKECGWDKSQVERIRSEYQNG